MAVRRSPCGRADEPLALTSVPYMTIDTYGYEGTTDSVVQDVENQAGVTVNAALDALGDRLASGTSGGYAWLIPDLHGNVVGQLNSSGTTVTDAFRYDAYGLTEGTVLSGSIPSPWRFQGKLLESTSGGRDLYDFEARSYSPDIGAFTSLDTVAGSATNPVTLDRYLYAGGNPETLIDPDGHTMLNCRNPDLCGMGGGPGASQAQIAKYLAQKRQEAHRLWSRYGERPGDDERTVASSGARAPDPLLTGGRDQAEDTLTTAQVQSADRAAGSLSCTVHGCTNANPSLNWTPIAIAAGVTAAGLACVAGVCEALGITAAAAGVADAVVTTATAAAGFVADVGAGWSVAGASGVCAAACPAAVNLANSVSAAVSGDPGVGPAGVASAAGGEAGIDITLHYGAGWTDAQITAADTKVAALNGAAADGALSVTPVVRTGTSAANVFRRSGGIVPAGSDVDHLIDLQLGGANTPSNMWPLDLTVNRSLGAQVACQIAGYAAGTPVRSVGIC